MLDSKRRNSPKSTGSRRSRRRSSDLRERGLTSSTERRSKGSTPSREEIVSLCLQLETREMSTRSALRTQSSPEPSLASSNEEPE